MTFEKWMQARGLSVSSIKKYVGALGGPLTSWARSAGLTQNSLLEIEDPAQFAQVMREMQKVPIFLERNAKGNHMYSGALEQYAAYISEPRDVSVDEEIESILEDTSISRFERKQKLESKLGDRNFWWVNQTDNWQDESEGGYLYAGESSSKYRRSILELNKGDIVICTRRSAGKRVIYALGYVEERPSRELVERREARNIPNGKGEALPKGWEVSIEYVTFDVPIEWEPIWGDIKDHCEGEHFTKEKSGIEGYLFPVPKRTAGEILHFMNVDLLPQDKFEISDAASPADTVTEVVAETIRRVGHQKWARDVKKMASGRCCATGFDVERLLTASHIVSWKEDKSCRLDRYNGLCLSPAYNAAFDVHLISIQNDGKIELATNFSEEAAKKIGIDPKIIIKGLHPRHFPYLERHRKMASKKQSESASGQS